MTYELSPIRRGGYRLPLDSHVTYTDPDGEYISQHFGETHMGYRRTPDEVASGAHGLPIPFEFFIYSPAGHTLCVRGFGGARDLATWLRAYDCKLEEFPGPGEMFDVRIPDNDKNWEPITLPEVDGLPCDGRRTWTTTGELLADLDQAKKGHAVVANSVFELRRMVVEAITKLAWKPPSSSLPATAGLMVNLLIDELRIPAVESVSWGVAIGECYELLGIKARYADGRAHIYAVDRGSDALIVASDFWPGKADRTAPRDIHSAGRSGTLAESRRGPLADAPTDPNQPGLLR